MPNIEQTRTEARIAQAYHEVRQMRDAQPEALSGVTPTTDSPPDTDPWGKPCRIVLLDGQQVRVLSSGPDTTFTPDRIDSDDIYSDMPTSPLGPIRTRKHRKGLIALAVTMGAWILLTSIYILSRRRAAR